MIRRHSCAGSTNTRLLALTLANTLLGGWESIPARIRRLQSEKFRIKLCLVKPGIQRSHVDVFKVSAQFHCRPIPRAFAAILESIEDLKTRTLFRNRTQSGKVHCAL